MILSDEKEFFMKHLNKYYFILFLFISTLTRVGLATGGVAPKDHRPPPPPQEYFERQILACYSNYYDPRMAVCPVTGEIYQIQFLRQLSYYQCVPNQTFGYTRDYVWVRGGCAAEFDVVTRHFRQPPDDGRDDHNPRPRPRPEEHSIICESYRGRYNECFVPGPGDILDVYVEEQISHRHCQEGTNWGYSYDRIWVDQGCTARFRVYKGYDNRSS